jgi:hypothetical protein
LCSPFHKKTVAEALGFMAEFGATVKLIAVPKGSRLVTGYFLMFGEKPAKRLTELERIFFLNRQEFYISRN